jgi:hypothetical protein
MVTQKPQTIVSPESNRSAMGWTYNTADDVENRGPQITAVAIVLTSASLGISLLRLYVRVWMIKAIGAGMYNHKLSIPGYC